MLIIFIITVNFIGVGSDYFFFERIENRFSAAINNPFEDSRESERLFSYVEPFYHLMNNPSNFFTGHSHTFLRQGLIDFSSANHSLFASSYYFFGLIIRKIRRVNLIMNVYFGEGSRSRHFSLATSFSRNII